MAREQRGQPAAMIMKVILTNVSCKKGAAMERGREAQKEGVKERWTKSIWLREIDGRLTKSRREGARMRGLSLPPTTEERTHAHIPDVEGEKGREGDAGSSMDHQDPHPHVSRAGVA